MGQVSALPCEDPVAHSVGPVSWPLSKGYYYLPFQTVGTFQR